MNTLLIKVNGEPVSSTRQSNGLPGDLSILLGSVIRSGDEISYDGDLPEWVQCLVVKYPEPGGHRGVHCLWPR